MNDNATIENQIADSIIQELNISSTNHIRKEMIQNIKNEKGEISNEH